MAESSLSLGVADLRKAIGFQLGYGRTSGNWTAAQLAEINELVDSGVRRVYFPPAVNADTVGYEWSWLRPTTTLAIIADDGNYDLPDDFGRMVGTLHYPADDHRQSIVIVSVGKILQKRAAADLNGAPTYAAIRYKSSDGSGGQRQEVLFYPEPDASWTLSYEYEAFTGRLTDSYPYPLGGMKYSELYLESCLSLAESRIEDAPGVHTQLFSALLVDAIARDRKHGSQNYGYMGQPQAHDDGEFRRGWGSGTYSITMNGVQISGT